MSSGTLLSLDLGLTTGFAIFDPYADMSLDGHGHILKDDLEQTLKRFLKDHLVRWSVAERPVIIRGSLGDQLQEVISITRRVLDHQVTLVDPAQWKQSPSAKITLPRGLSTQEIDDIRLGFWFQETHKGG
jgi:hypothetical protein